MTKDTQIYFWAHMLDEAMNDKTCSDSFVSFDKSHIHEDLCINEVMTDDYDKKIYTKIKSFFKKLTMNNISTLKMGELRLEDFIDIYNFQSGGYRTIQKTDILIDKFINSFGHPTKLNQTVYRGTDNDEEIESMMNSDKNIVNHALSFSMDESIARGFGKKFIIELTVKDAKFIDLQKYVSTFLKVLTDLNVTAACSYLHTQNDKNAIARNKFTDKMLKNVSKLDAIEQSKTYASYDVSKIYNDICSYLSVRDSGNSDVLDQSKPIPYDPIEMKNEKEVIFKSDTIFKFDRLISSEQPPYHYCFSAYENRESSRRHTRNIRTKLTGDYDQVNVNILSKMPVEQRITDVYEKMESEGVIQIPKILKKEITTFEISRRISEINENAFSGCINLKKISIPENITSIGDFAFDSCIKLRNIAIHKNIIKIGKQAFSCCSKLSNVIFDHGCAHLGSQSFEQCFELKKLIIPESMEMIGDGAFSQSGIEYIYIPDSVQQIGKDAFFECFNIKNIFIPRKFKNKLNDIGIYKWHDEMQIQYI